MDTFLAPFRTAIVIGLALLTVFGPGLGPVHAAAGLNHGNVAAGPSVEQQLLENAEQLEDYLEQEQYVDARLLLLQLQELLPQLSFADKTTVEGMEAIAETFVQLKRLLSGVQLQQDKIRHAAEQFSLAADALIHPGLQEESRWKARLEALVTQLGALRQTGTPPTESAVDRLLQEYDVLRPALLVRAPTHVVSQLDGLHQKMRQLKLRRSPSEEEWAVLFEQAAEQYQHILRGSDWPTLGETRRSSFTQLMLGLMAFLILSLTYTAWCYRMFRDTKGT